MALTRTQRAHLESTRNSDFWGSGAHATSVTRTTASFTPSNNSLLVLMVATEVDGSNFQTFSISDSAGLTWTARGTGGLGVWNGAQIFTAPVTTGTSMTVTVTMGRPYSNFICNIQ